MSDLEEHWTLWDAASGVVSMTGARHDGAGSCVCSLIKRGGEKGVRKFLDAGCPVQAHTAGLLAVAVSPCTERLATGGEDSAVILWDARTGTVELVLQGHTDHPNSVSFSATGERLVTGDMGGSIYVWGAMTGGLLRTIRHGGRGVHCCPMENRKIVAMHNGSMKQWDIESGELLHSGEGEGFAVYSPDGRTIATAKKWGLPTDGEVVLVDAESGATRMRLEARHLFSVAWSVDGSSICWISCACNCRVLDLSTGASIGNFNLGFGIRSVTWGRDWLLGAQRVTAFVMGHHPRLGAGSQVLGLDEELLRMILDRV